MKTLEKLKAVCHHNQERRAMGDHSKMRKGERGNQLCSSLTLDHCFRTSLKAQAKVSLGITYRQCKEVKKKEIQVKTDEHLTLYSLPPPKQLGLGEHVYPLYVLP